VKIRAAVSREGEPAPLIEDVELGDPLPGEMLVRIAAAGICHTDIRTHAVGGWGSPKPIVLGHEGAGIVERVGSGVKRFKPGDRVVLSGSSCGICPSCQDNLPTYCREAIPRMFGGRRIDGSTALSQHGSRLAGHFFGQSSFATYALAEERSAIPVPDDVPFDVVAPMGCGIVTGAGSVFYSFSLRPGQSIAVFGAGSVGLSAIMAARLCGASHIVAVDPVPERRSLAEELGATATIDPAAGDVVSAVRALVSEGVDFSFNTTNVPAVYEVAVQVLATRGIAGFVTRPDGEWQAPMTTLLAGGRTLRGIIGGDAPPQITIPMMIDYWRQGRFPVDRLIRHYPFEEIGKAFDDCHHGRAIKPVLQMPA
jgi:aryl-alcohol dehydrogenase